ncbi:MAG: HAMP domain-containing protein [Sedimentisphaerales bacterium]|nr:HAMP domain-containing protein [Sedimentisphaerales bacterium]
MKIWLKLMLGFSAIVVLVVIKGFMSIKISQDTLQKQIGKSHQMLAAGLMSDLDRSIYHRIEALQEYCNDSTLQKVVKNSNEEFEKLDDIRAYISEKDRQWTSVPAGQLSPFMTELTANELSKELGEKVEFLGQRNDYRIFGEIFATNKYGANAAMTSKTTDYYQADEDWWRQAKEKGLYVEDIVYDDSADIFSLDVCIKITDKAGNFLGVMKAVLNIQDTINILKQYEAHTCQKEKFAEFHHHGPHKGIVTKLSNPDKQHSFAEIKLNRKRGDIELWTGKDSGLTQPLDLPLDSDTETIEFKLLNKDGKIIYATDEHVFLEKIDEKILAELENTGKKPVSFIFENDEPGEGKKLYSFARSMGFEDHKGFGWILLVEHKTKDIFAPVARLRNILLITLGVFTVIAFIIGVLISYSISKPLEKITEAMGRLGKGKLGTRVFIKKKNEFGILAGSLNKMASNLQRAQAQQVQNEKLTSIGQLAAGVAHEMNTPVGFVASNFQTLESYIKKIRGLVVKYDELIEQINSLENAELKNKTKDIDRYRDETKMDFILEDLNGLFSDSKEGLDRVTTIIQSLRDFSRIDQPGSRDEYDINKGIQATLVVAGNEIKYDADVKTEFSEVPKIFCHSGQINQVFLNILVNAAHAIKSQQRQDRGTITIRTYTSDDNNVVCEIADNGPGIPESNISKIFDPFFTTKPVGKGTGLGLSVSYDIIVNKHNGSLTVDSHVGKGTIFTITLPVGIKENKEKETAENGKANSTIC